MCIDHSLQLNPQRFQSAQSRLRRRTTSAKQCLRVVATAIGLLTLGRGAWAADLAPPAAAAPGPYNWNGIYFGGNIGYGGTSVTENFSGVGNGTATTNLPGGVGGAQIGSNYQVGNVVFGFEADFDGSMATKSMTAPGIASGNVQIPWLATLRGRLGYAFDHYLVYATAGGAASELHTAVTNFATGESATTSNTHSAWTAGGGIEVGITDNASARLEYLYMQSGTFNVATVSAAPNNLAVSARVQENLVRAGLNIRFPVAW
jgi:outer membrane immunogenic protein